MKWLGLTIAMAMTAAAPAVQAQTVEAVAAAEKAYKAALQKTPLTLPVALFVKETATGYGMYEARATNHFKVGEPLNFYVEPLGYKFKHNGDKTSFGVTMDLRITQNGRTLFSKDNFLNIDLDSHHDNAEFNVNGSLNLTGAAAGNYELELLVRDHASAETAHTKLPFTID